jgi:uncharacterized protein YraI
MTTTAVPTTTTRRRRAVARGLVPLAAVGALAAIPSVAAAGPSFPTAADDASGLMIRSNPNDAGSRIGKVPSGASVEVLCQTTGPSVSDRKYGTTTIWDRISYGGTTGYVTDLYVLSNQDRIAGVGSCDDGAPAGPIGSGLPPTPAPGPGAAARPSWVPAQYWPTIQAAAAKEGLDARLLAAQLKIESNFRPTVCSEAGACGIAQFLPSTWKQSWNPNRGVAKGYDSPAYAIPSQARFMHRLLDTARTKDPAAIRARVARRSDVPRSTLNAIDFGDRYQLALMAYHGGWDLSGWGPRTAKYPVNIVAQSRKG